MQRFISRSIRIQRKFISMYTKVNQFEMALYNEKPQMSTSLVVCFGEDKPVSKPVGIRTLTSGISKTIYSSDSNFFVLHTKSPINIPVIEEGVDIQNAPVVTLVNIVKWLAKTPDSGSKDSIQPGTRLGRLDAANEAGFFHRTDRSRLKEIKKKLKDKPAPNPTEPKKTE